MVDARDKDTEEPKGFLQEAADGYRKAVKKVDQTIGGLGAIACQPVVAYGAGVEYIDSRIKGKSHEEAKKAAGDWYEDTTDRTVEFCQKHAPKVRRAISIAHGIDHIDTSMQALGDWIDSTPPIPYVPVQPFDPGDV